MKLNSTHRAKILKKLRTHKKTQKSKQIGTPHSPSGEQVYSGQDSKKSKSRLKPRLKSRLQKVRLTQIQTEIKTDPNPNSLLRGLKSSVAESGFVSFPLFNLLLLESPVEYVLFGLEFWLWK